jgi:hypothetical protein
VAAPQPAQHFANSLFKSPIESTRDVYGKGTVLWDQGTSYVETITIELIAASRAERRAMIRGMRKALAPLEDRPSLKLRLPTYFDRVATFTVLNTQVVDSAVSLGRRHAVLSVDLRVPEVELENYVKLRPQVDTNVGPDVDTE